jgi:hypothetical protein
MVRTLCLYPMNCPWRTESWLLGCYPRCLYMGKLLLFKSLHWSGSVAGQPFNFNWELWTCWLHLSADLSWISATWTLSWIICASQPIFLIPFGNSGFWLWHIIQKVKLSLVLFIKHHTMKMYEWVRFSPTELDLGTRCRPLVFVMIRPFYPRKSVSGAPCRRKGGYQS